MKDFDVKKYVIFKTKSSGEKEYVYEINKNNVYTTNDIHSAMLIDDVDAALVMSKYITRRESGSYLYQVMSIITTCEVIEEES